MQFVQDAIVYTAQGEPIGEVDRVVLNPGTREVTHIVVREGLIFTEDKVVSLDLIASATEERVVLREGAGDMQRLPKFEAEFHIPGDVADQEQIGASASRARPVYWYPPFGTSSLSPDYQVETKRLVPEGTVPLKEGAPVISADGQHVGVLERVLTDPQLDRATHFVIAKGLFFKERKSIPVTWVSDLEEDQVYLTVGTNVLEGLPEYES